MVSLVVGILGSVTVARLGGAEVKGVASAFAAANAIGFMVVNFDLGQQVLREARESGGPGRVLPTLSKAWVVYSVVGAIVLLVGLVWDMPVLWLAIGTLAFSIGTQAGVVTTGLVGVVVSAVGAIMQQLALMAATLVLSAFDDLNTDTIRIAIVISYLAPLTIYLPFLVKAGGASKGGQLTPLWSLARKGSVWQVGRFFQMLLQKVDTIVVFTVLGAAAAGIYSVALSTAMLCTIMPAQFANKTMFDATAGGRVRAARATRSALLSGGATAVGIASLGLLGLRVLYGPEFVAAYPSLLACLGGAIAYGVVQVQTIVIRMLGTWKHLLLTSGVGLGVMGVGLSLLVSPWGPLGAGVSFSLGTTASALIGAVVGRRLEGRQTFQT